VAATGRYNLLILSRTFRYQAQRREITMRHFLLPQWPVCELSHLAASLFPPPRVTINPVVSMYWHRVFSPQQSIFTLMVEIPYWLRTRPGFPAKTMKIFFLSSSRPIQTDCGAHPMGIGGYFPGDKVAEA